MILEKERHGICVCALAFVLVIGLAACSGIQGRTEEYSRSFFAMDTYMTFTVYGNDTESAEEALRQAENEIGRLEALWSVTDEGSDIYALNHSDGQGITVHGETAGLVSFALEMAERTDGALEPTLYPLLSAWGFTTGENHIPDSEQIEKLLEKVGYDRVEVEEDRVSLEEGMMLDLGAVGKGYAGDMVEQVLRENGITSALLDIGGNIQAVGTKPDGSEWRLGMRNPFGEGIFGVLQIFDCAVVTSGNYERYFIGEDGVRYGHIIDPDTGYPVDNGLASVTVIAGEGKLCDALSTSLFVMGKEGAVAYWKAHQDCQAFDMILVTKEKEVYLTEGIKEKFDLQSDRKDMSVHVIS